MPLCRVCGKMVFPLNMTEDGECFSCVENDRRILEDAFSVKGGKTALYRALAEAEEVFDYSSAAITVDDCFGLARLYKKAEQYDDAWNILEDLEQQLSDPQSYCRIRKEQAEILLLENGNAREALFCICASFLYASMSEGRDAFPKKTDRKMACALRRLGYDETSGDAVKTAVTEQMAVNNYSEEEMRRRISKVLKSCKKEKTEKSDKAQKGATRIPIYDPADRNELAFFLDCNKEAIRSAVSAYDSAEEPAAYAFELLKEGKAEEALFQLYLAIGKKSRNPKVYREALSILRKNGLFEEELKIAKKGAAALPGDSAYAKKLEERIEKLEEIRELEKQKRKKQY